MEKYLDKLHKHVEGSGLFAVGAKLLLAVSGGSDSVALLCLMARLRSRYPVTLLCCHVNHGLRGRESDADEALTRELCLRLNVPVIVRKVEIKAGADLENRARGKRFEALFQLLELYRFDYIVMGHQRDDQAETVLMNMLRGAGVSGLAGIKASGGRILHPLLDFSREELRDYLRLENVSWCEDGSNQQLDFRRNRIRHELIPCLQQHYSLDIKDKLYKQSLILADADDYFCDLARVQMKKLGLESIGGGISFEVLALGKLSRIELYYLMKLAYASISGVPRDFFYHHFEELQGIMQGGGSVMIRLLNQVVVYREYGRLSFEPEAEQQDLPEPVYIEEDRARVVYGSFRFCFRHLRVLPRRPDYDRYSIVIDADRITWPLVIRSRRDGDRFVPHGMDNSKKLKDFLIDAKVPRRLRDTIPILVDSEQILWVVGYRADGRILANQDSSKLLEINVELITQKPKRAASRIRPPGGKNESDELRYFSSPF